MHVEVRVAINFLISFLYNKLPRRRVNQFGDELETVLKAKFEGHWYVDQPYKGSAYRCVRCAPPLDPLTFEVAARNSGMNIVDIQQNIPPELSIWVDPGEVSYRITEKGPVKILYNERTTETKENIITEPISALNPDAQCFKPIDQNSVTNRSCMNNSVITPFQLGKPAPIGAGTGGGGGKNNVPNNGTVGNGVTFTTAMFAATKFGSTKLKSIGNKKGQRNSTTTDINQLMGKSRNKQEPILAIPNRHNGNGSFSFGANLDVPLLPTFNSNQSFDLSMYSDGWNSITNGNIWSAPLHQSPAKSNTTITTTANNNNNSNLNANWLDNTWNIDSSNLLSMRTNYNDQSTNNVDPDNNQLNCDRVWEDILHMTDNIVQLDLMDNGSTLTIPNIIDNNGANDSDGVDVSGNDSNRNEPLYCSPFSLSSESSPSLSSSNESSLSLVNEFDNLSLNSSSSCSTGSVSSYII
ncbi:hypothetical protein RDWZM_008200 [Blomia tropicalis]|uniref:Anti-proliferative protein domain-containing protein n=1 Tax=Blomia tropicalis TaxID=40697 RepID=A0A9Q0RIN1_BLOTA|nr:transducer of ERBB2 [Blomia tropicalis]KAJ6217043.1 hypothetical protein RDWZM_008200 [Blomia tropicalis]